MQSSEVCARQVVEARHSLSKLEALDPRHRPITMEEAYRVQRAAIEAWGDEIAGWKVGATSYEIQKLFGITECVYGPVFKKSVFSSPARLSAADFQHLLLESEFAFRFSRGLAARSTPYALQEVLDSVDALFPAFEIVSPRFPRLTIDDIPQLVAEFCANGGAILGSPFTSWKGHDLSSHRVELWIGGELRQAGTGASVIGNPLNALEWLVNVLSAQGVSIGRGQFVVTGTTTGLHAPTRGQPAMADFGKFGKVEVVFT
jgi:2-keto-4-pentenoate hydratase